MKTEKSISFAVVHGEELPVDKVVSSVRSIMSPAKLPKHRVMITTSKGTSSLSVIIWNGITVESGFDTRSVFEGIKKSVKGAEVISVSSKIDKESAVRKALI